MPIRTVVTRGFGNGTFTGTIADTARRGYTSAVVTVIITKRLTLIGTSAQRLSLSGTAGTRLTLEGSDP